MRCRCSNSVSQSYGSCQIQNLSFRSSHRKRAGRNLPALFFFSAAGGRLVTPAVRKLGFCIFSPDEDLAVELGRKASFLSPHNIEDITMRILFEILERDRFEIYDPAIPAAAETQKIIYEAGLHDTVRILKFCPSTMQISDMTDELYAEYRGDFDETSPLWIKQQPDFEDRAAEQRRESWEWRLTVAAA
jgi:hypothetical protein